MCNTKPLRIHMPTQSFVPCSFQFLERTNRLFKQEWNDCVPILFCVPTGMQSFCRHVFNLPVQMGTEQFVSFHFSYHFLVVPSCGTERLYLKRSRLNATLHHSTLRNSTERSGRSAFPFNVVISYIVKWQFQFL